MKKMLIDLVLLVLIPFSSVLLYFFNPKIFEKNIRKSGVMLIVYFLLAFLTTTFITPHLQTKKLTEPEQKAFWNVEAPLPLANPIPPVGDPKNVEAQTKRFFQIDVSPSPPLPTSGGRN